MGRESIPINVNGIPKLREIAEEVEASGEGRMLRRDGKDIAMIVPIPPPKHSLGRKRSKKKDLEAFRSAAGTWKDVDIDKFLEDNYASRQVSTRPPVEL